MVQIAVKKTIKKSLLRIVSPFVMLTAKLIEEQKKCRTLMIRLGKYLVYQNKLKNSDIIVILGGGSVERVRTGAKLYQSGWAHKLLIYKSVAKSKLSPGNTTTTQEAVYLRVKSRDIIHDNSPRNTFDEINILIKTLNRLKLNSAIIVSDAFHTRRASLLYQHHPRHGEFQVLFYPTKTKENQFNPQMWWHNNEDTKNLISEYVAIGVMFIKFYFGHCLKLF